MRATVALSMLALPHLIKTKGSVVNISSIAAWRPVSNLVTTSLLLFVNLLLLTVYWKYLLCNVESWNGYVYEIFSFWYNFFKITFQKTYL